MEGRKEMLTMAEVVAELGISRATVERLIREGQLQPAPKNPLLKKYHRRLFRREDVERLKPPA